MPPRLEQKAQHSWKRPPWGLKVVHMLLEDQSTCTGLQPEAF